MSNPLFSVLVPVYKPDLTHFQACIDSVLNQHFTDLQLVLVADGPQPNDVIATMKQDDARIAAVFLERNVGIAGASDEALKNATGDFVALLDNDDLLPDRALQRIADVLAADQSIDMLYTDEDKIDPAGNRVDPFFKPAFSLARLRTQMYTGHLGVYRRSLVLKVGGFRPGFDGSQDHDLALRASEQARSIAHIPEVLYHWRQGENSTALDASSKSWAFEAGKRAVQSALDRTGFPAVANRNPHNPGVLNLTPQLKETPLVSVVVPTGGGTKVIVGQQRRLVDNAITTLVEESSYPNFEVVVVRDARSTQGLADELCAIDPRVRVVQDTRAFNFAGACNLGAIEAAGQILLFLNDDTEVIQPDWVERLVMYATRPEVGAVGAKLLYGDERIQHAGVWSRFGGPGHRYPGFDRMHPGHMGSLWCAQDCLAVTAACLMIERSKFEAVGGFSESFPLNFNDVDLCLKLRSAGWNAIVDCGTEVIHHESATRDPAVKDWEYHQLRDRWSEFLSDDFWDNPNHTGHGVQEFPATSEVLLQSWEAVNGNYREARIWHAASTMQYGS